MGLRGASILGYSLLLGEEIAGHLQLSLISRRVRLEPSEKPVGGFGPSAVEIQEDRDKCVPAQQQ